VSRRPTEIKDLLAWMRALLASEERGVVKLVGLRLALHVNNTTGRCDPSYPTLGKGTNMSSRSAMRAISALAERQWIAIEPRAGTSNFFHLLPPEGVTKLCQGWG
jgi:hypothetical protein